MISWRWKVSTALMASVLMALVLLWPETARASHGTGSTRLYPSEPELAFGGPGAYGIEFTIDGTYTMPSIVAGLQNTTYPSNCILKNNTSGANVATYTRPSTPSAGWYTMPVSGSTPTLTAGNTYQLWCEHPSGAGSGVGWNASAAERPFTNADGHITVTRVEHRATWCAGCEPDTENTGTGAYALDPILVPVVPTATPTPVPALNQVISDGTTILQESGVYGGTARGNVVRVMNSGSITHMRIGRSTDQSATVQWAIYPFGATAPLAQGTAAGLSVGWNTIDIPDISITAGFYVPTIYVQAGDQFGYITGMTCPSGQGNNTGSTQIYYAGPCARFQEAGFLVYPSQVEGGNLMYAVDMRVNAPASVSATATPWATSTPFSVVGTATPAATVTQYNTPDLVGAVNRLGDILQRVGDQITAAILVHGIMQSLTTLLDKINDLVYQLTQLPLLLASSMTGVLALPSPDYIDLKNAELDLLIDAKTGGLGGIIEHLDFVEDLLEPDCVGWTGVEFTLPNPRPGQPPMAFAFPPGQLWDNIYCPYIRPWLSLSLNFVFLFVAWRNGLKIFRLKG